MNPKFRFRLARKLGLVGLLSAVALSAAPAQAHSLILFGPQIGHSVFFLISTSGHCTTYVYDTNGNRLSVTVGTIDAGPVLWGSANYGCFAWGQ